MTQQRAVRAHCTVFIVINKPEIPDIAIQLSESYDNKPQLYVDLLSSRASKWTESELLRGAWRMMNFRQRMGWIGVGLYLLASIAAVYYMFEINQTYNRLTLTHVEQVSGTHAPWTGDAASSSSSSSSWTQSVKTKLLLLPFWVWATIFLIPYLQVFLFLYSCTRADPKTVGYCILPICLAVLCNRHQTFTKASNQISRLQLIDT